MYSDRAHRRWEEQASFAFHYQEAVFSVVVQCHSTTLHRVCGRWPGERHLYFVLVPFLYAYPASFAWRAGPTFVGASELQELGDELIKEIKNQHTKDRTGQGQSSRVGCVPEINPVVYQTSTPD